MSPHAPRNRLCAGGQAQFDHHARRSAAGAFRVMAGHPRAWEKFRGGSLLDKGPLSLREREIVIDRTCALNACEYEWGVHVATFAAAAELTQEQVRATVHGAADAACWSAAEQAMVAAVDALHARSTLDDAEFKALAAHYDETQNCRWRCHRCSPLRASYRTVLVRRASLQQRAGTAAGRKGREASA